MPRDDFTFVPAAELPFASLCSRGRLPHLFLEGATYFITFRLADAVVPGSACPSSAHVPRASGAALAASCSARVPRASPDGRSFEQVVARCEPPLMQGSCALRDPLIAGMVQDALLYFDIAPQSHNQMPRKRSGRYTTSAESAQFDKTLRRSNAARYSLHAWTVMPNHVHVIVTPLASHTPGRILHAWKSFTAKRANGMLNRTGAFWETESFDHAIRSADGFERFVDYVEQNAVIAGLAARAEDYRFCSAYVRRDGGQS